MKVLNLYAGIGGNRLHWPGEFEITAVEYNEKIAAVYERYFPSDKIVIGDAHQYLLDHHQEFDFIWSSPPCQSHSRMIRSGRNRKPRYPDLRLYEEVLFLQHNFEGWYVVENVVPYYEPLLSAVQRGRHLFWANYEIPEFESPQQPKDFINMTTVAGKEKLMDWIGIYYSENIYYEGSHCPAQVLRNAVHPEVGKIVFEAGCYD